MKQLIIKKIDCKILIVYLLYIMNYISNKTYPAPMILVPNNKVHSNDVSLQELPASQHEEQSDLVEPNVPNVLQYLIKLHAGDEG